MTCTRTKLIALRSIFVFDSFSRILTPGEVEEDACFSRVSITENEIGKKVGTKREIPWLGWALPIPEENPKSTQLVHGFSMQSVHYNTGFELVRKVSRNKFRKNVKLTTCVKLRFRNHVGLRPLPPLLWEALSSGGHCTFLQLYEIRDNPEANLKKTSGTIFENSEPLLKRALSPSHLIPKTF